MKKIIDKEGTALSQALFNALYDQRIDARNGAELAKERAEMKKNEAKIAEAEALIQAELFERKKQQFSDMYGLHHVADYFTERAMDFFLAMGQDMNKFKGIDPFPCNVLSNDVIVFTICEKGSDRMKIQLALPSSDIWGISEIKLQKVRKVTNAAGLDEAYINEIYTQYLKSYLRT